MVLDGFTPFPLDLAEKYRSAGLWRDMTIGDLLDRAAAAHPQKTALVDDKVRVIYQELAERVNRLALGLLELGIRKEDRVTVQLPNVAEFVYFYLALTRIGAVGVLILPQHRSREVEYMLQLTESVAFVCPTVYRGFDYPAMIREIQPRLPHLKHLIVAEERGSSEAISLTELMEEGAKERDHAEALRQVASSSDDVSVILWTGGTTANPKGGPHTHNTLIGYVTPIDSRWGYHSQSIFFLSAPVAHMAGLSLGVNAALLHGATLILLTATGPEETLQTIQRERVTHTFLVPTQAIAVLNSPSLPQYDLSSLEVVGSGAAHVPPELVQEMKERLGCKVVNCYGMTEGLASFTYKDDPHEITAETVGRPT